MSGAIKDRDWFKEIRRQIFGAASPCTVSLHQAGVMWREIDRLRNEKEGLQKDNDSLREHINNMNEMS